MGESHTIRPATDHLLERLARLAPDALWSAGDARGVAALRRYLSRTIEQLRVQDKTVLAKDAQGEMLVFNTGLLDAAFEEVFGVCTPHSSDDEEGGWEMRDFCTAGRSRFGRRMARALRKGLPPRATYASCDADLVADAAREIEVDCAELVAQWQCIAPQALESLGIDGKPGGDSAALLARALDVAIGVGRARLRHMPTCALPAWGPCVDLRGLVFCLPLSLTDSGLVDALLALEERTIDGRRCYAGRKLLRAGDAYEAARVVREPDAGMGWACGLLEQHEMSNGRQASVGTSSAESRVRLTCRDGRVPAYVVRSGDTLGILRRHQGERPRIVLPSQRGFEGVSQIQGRFDVRDGLWEFVHLGSNWTKVKHADRRVVVLRERGVREAVGFGDELVFSGSPAFVLGR